MNTMTFIGRTTREAMSLAKARFGADVQIVDSRQTPAWLKSPIRSRHSDPSS